MPTFVRYLFFQIPGWVIAAVVALLLLQWEIVPLWLALSGFFGWVVKDLACYPLLRTAYETHAVSGAEALIGKKGVAQSDLQPDGYVRVSGELWRASADTASEGIAAGTEVEIVSAEGMTVAVRASRRN